MKYKTTQQWLKEYYPEVWLVYTEYKKLTRRAVMRELMRKRRGVRKGRR